jgi:hypothetical protein
MFVRAAPFYLLLSLFDDLLFFSCFVGEAGVSLEVGPLVLETVGLLAQHAQYDLTLMLAASGDSWVAAFQVCLHSHAYMSGLQCPFLTIVCLYAVQHCALHARCHRTYGDAL